MLWILLVSRATSWLPEYGHHLSPGAGPAWSAELVLKDANPLPWKPGFEKIAPHAPEPHAAYGRKLFHVGQGGKGHLRVQNPDRVWDPSPRNLIHSMLDSHIGQILGPFG